MLRSASNQNHFHKTQRKQWPYPDRNYVEFTLKKRGKDTMSVINSICNACRRAAKAFSVYGTKDKRAVTFQKVVAYRISPVGVSFLDCLLERVENGSCKNQGYFHRRLLLCERSGFHREEPRESIYDHAPRAASEQSGEFDRSSSIATG